MVNTYVWFYSSKPPYPLSQTHRGREDSSPRGSQTSKRPSGEETASRSYFFFALITLEYLFEHSPGSEVQTRELTVSFLELVQLSELAGVMKNLMALNPQMSVLAPEPLRNVCCVSPWSVLAEAWV